MRLFPYRTFLLSIPPHEVINLLLRFIRPEGPRGDNEDRWYVGTIHDNGFKMKRNYVISNYYKERIPGNSDSFRMINGKVESHAIGTRILLEIVPSKWGYLALVAMYLFATLFGVWLGFTLHDFSNIVLFLFLPFGVVMYLFHVVFNLIEMRRVGRDMQAFLDGEVFSKKHSGAYDQFREMYRLKT